jgi:amphi-Trp domain-containing protein
MPGPATGVNAADHANCVTTAHPAQRDRGCERSGVTNFKHEEYLSRQRAAERLVDIAYSLTAGGTLELRTGGDQVKVPVVDQVLLTRESRTDGDRVVVEVWLRWSA